MRIDDRDQRVVHGRVRRGDRAVDVAAHLEGRAFEVDRGLGGPQEIRRDGAIGGAQAGEDAVHGRVDGRDQRATVGILRHLRNDAQDVLKTGCFCHGGRYCSRFRPATIVRLSPSLVLSLSKDEDEVMLRQAQHEGGLKRIRRPQNRRNLGGERPAVAVHQRGLGVPDLALARRPAQLSRGLGDQEDAVHAGMQTR